MENGLSRNEARMEDGHGYGVAEAGKELAAIHQVFRDVLDALVTSCKRNEVMLGATDFAIAMEGVGEALADAADSALGVLPNESYTPDNAKTLIDNAYRCLVEHFRVNPIDWDKELTAVFRPQPTRGSAPTNPETLKAKGEAV
jgi:hypothetical protein